MTLQEREKAIAAVCRLGEMFRRGNDDPQLARAVEKAESENPWFTPQSVLHAARQWGVALTDQGVRRWVERYPLPARTRNVLLVLAGNIPMVGLHDILCAYLSGHRAVVKPSRDDTALIAAALDCLKEAETSLAGRLVVTPGLVRENIDAVIATGSDDTQRYFRYYFQGLPALLRHARHSVGVIGADTTDAQLALLADDILLYFGLGCRSVSQVLVPQDFDMRRLCRALDKHACVAGHSKYRNNYDYRRAMYALTGQNDGIYDTGFFLLIPQDGPAAPLGTAGYRRYACAQEVGEYLAPLKDRLQCVVGPGYLPFGSAQRPALDDYADGEDTMNFLRFND